MFRSRALAIGLLALFLTGAASATTVTLSEGFESFNTGSVAGQNGWGIFSPSFPETITTAQAHAGSTKSLYTGMPAPYNQPATAGATKALDPATQGEYPNSSVTFPISYGSSWWAQAWVRVESGGVGAVFTVLGITTQSLKIAGDGTVSVIPGGTPVVLPNQGSGASRLDEWLFVRIAHDPSMGVTSELLEVTVLGPGTNLSFRTQYFSSSPYARYLVLAGDAYWDDVMVGTGLAPAIVPVPAAGWLFAGAIGALTGWRRRDARRS
jgi:hypothetical protein